MRASVYDTSPLSGDFTMTTATSEPTASPLTVLSEEEQMFQQSVRDFAVEKIRPLVTRMDHDAQMSKELISAFFDLGIMGIEVPDQWGGAGASFFTAVLRSEEHTSELQSRLHL